MMNGIGLPEYGRLGTLSERNEVLLKAAYLYGVPAYAYRLMDVDEFFRTGELPAVCWNNGALQRCRIDFPKYTEFYYGIAPLKEYYLDAITWIKENTILTDVSGITKFVLQKKLLESDLSQNAIPTFPICTFAELCAFKDLIPMGFLKPASGRKAVGTMKIHRQDGKYFYSTPAGSGELTEKVFAEYYAASGYSEGTWLLFEPCLNILNDDGHAVDFRCLVSINGENMWQNVVTYARVGSSGVASNVSRGGAICAAEDVLELFSPGNGGKMLSEINTVAVKVAELVQREAKKPVSWLGIDICVDRSTNQIYVIEANSKPGIKYYGQWQLALVRAQYFTYLLSRNDA